MKRNLRGDYVNRKIAEGHYSSYISNLRLLEYGIISELFGGGMHIMTGWAFSAVKTKYPKEYEEIRREIYCE